MPKSNDNPVIFERSDSFLVRSTVLPIGLPLPCWINETSILLFWKSKVVAGYLSQKIRMSSVDIDPLTTLIVI